MQHYTKEEMKAMNHRYRDPRGDASTKTSNEKWAPIRESNSFFVRNLVYPVCVVLAIPFFIVELIFKK